MLTTEEISLPKRPLVVAQWLSQNLNNGNVKVLEAKLKPIGASENWESGLHLPNAILIDIEDTFSVKTSDLPHTLLSESDFTKAAQELGINKEDVLVVYDQVGIYSSPRVWWMFKVMGHQNVFVLDGGLPAWHEAKFDSVKTLSTKTKLGNFVASFDHNFFMGTEEVVNILADKSFQIVDARSAERFKGIAPEPRKGLRSGHMPSAKNLPYDKVINGIYLKSDQELKALFEDLVEHDQKIVTTCGSGVTACIVAFAATMAEYANVAVYDGSWSEWGLSPDLPAEL